MSEAVSRILSEVNQLAEPERAELAFQILRTLGPDPEPSPEELAAELARRAEEIRSGKVVGRPVAEVFERLRSRRP